MPAVSNFAPAINETISSSTGSVIQPSFSQSVVSPNGGSGAGIAGNGSASYGSLSAFVYTTTGGGAAAPASLTGSGSASFSDDLFVDTGLGGGTIQYSVAFGLMFAYRSNDELAPVLQALMDND